MLILITFIVCLAAELPAYANHKERDKKHYLEYWERSSYHEGFKDGFETGVSKVFETDGRGKKPFRAKPIQIIESNEITCAAFLLWCFCIVQ